MIPEGWKEVLLDSITKRGSGHTPNKEHPEYWNGGIKWVSLADSSKLDDRYIFSTEKEISSLGIENSSAVLHKAGTVILSRDAAVGKSAILAFDMAVSQHFIAWKCSKSISNIFLYYFLQKEKKEFERQAIGSTIKTIGLPYFKKFKILLPPLAEQKKIAEILSTWDEAISVVDKQLENCRLQKKALMQQLLTGKKRLPGFSGEWKFLPIKQIAQRIQRASDGEAHPVLTISSLSRFVRQEDKYARDMAGKSVERYILLQKGEFAYNKGNSKTYPCGCVFDLYEYESGLVPNVYVCFKLNEGNSLEFYRYVFEFDCIRFQLENLINTGVRNNGLLNIKPEDFMNVKVPVPSIEEQKTLADIFMKQDEIIRILSKKLATLQEEKKSLMQQLLTGKKRVAVEE